MDGFDAMGLGFHLNIARWVVDSMISSPPNTSDRTNSHITCQFQEMPRPTTVIPITAMRNPCTKACILVRSLMGRPRPRKAIRVPKYQTTIPNAINAIDG